MHVYLFTAEILPQDSNSGTSVCARWLFIVIHSIVNGGGCVALSDAHHAHWPRDGVCWYWEADKLGWRRQIETLAILCKYGWHDSAERKANIISANIIPAYLKNLFLQNYITFFGANMILKLVLARHGWSINQPRDYKPLKKNLFIFTRFST